MSQLSVLLVGYGFRGRHWAEACAGRSDLAFRGVVDPDKPDGVPRRLLDVLGWSAAVGLDEGLRRTYDRYAGSLRQDDVITSS
jgi:nucleoside-diphosphate-sugar epimerase